MKYILLKKTDQFEDYGGGMQMKKGYLRMTHEPYWNHNVAYYAWIKRKISECHAILDVDGSLV